MKKALTLFLALIMGASILTGCFGGKADDKIVGEWEYADGQYNYVFEEDGSGVYNYVGNSAEFTYTIDGDALKLSFTDVDVEYQFSVDGSKLTLTGADGIENVYSKK